MGTELVALIALSCGCSGLLCGWFLRNPSGLPQSAAPSSDAEKNRNERDRLEKIAASLRSVTTSVAAEVDAHQTKIQAVSDSLSDSDEDHVLDAVASLIAANAMMQQQLGDAQNQIRSQAAAIESAEEMALTDALTGLNNRRALDRQMTQRHELGDTVAHPTTFMLIDVDHFKNFNDLHGHLTGDEVLKHVGRLLTTSLSDVGFVARYGGEEFAVLFNDMKVAEIKDRADAVRETFGEQEFFVDDQCLQVTASAGLAQLEPGETIESWIERADNALYNAKDEGRNQAYWMDGDVAFPVKSEDEEEAADTLAAAASDQPEESIVEPPEEPIVEPAAESIVGPAEESIVGPSEDPSEESIVEPAAEPTAGPAEETAGGVDVADLTKLSEKVASGFIKLQAERIPFCMLSIRVESDKSDDAWKQITLDCLHTSVRGIDADRIGFDGDRTFIVCLPSTDESVAGERAKTIRQSIDGASGSAWSVEVTTTRATGTETFEEAIQRAIGSSQTADRDEPAIV
ncbi:Response regulator PleD [Rosistilla oblonga]|uniref:GGDEF domain-containing protein n=1 Tax=Rosistilla oblonga TaxID=2527990 RepID=UPI00118D04BC|nr:GGDEF domain-containing protein [Rosistilla oblonga]QDV10257.1 Response regulator PleD [Rosistilla oblonga]